MAILVDTDSLDEPDKDKCSAAEGFKMAPSWSGCSADVENAYDRPENSDDEIGNETPVVTPDRYASLDLSAESFASWTP